MKKLFNFALISIMTLVLTPSLISAEVKEVDDVIYVVDELGIKDFVCDEIKNDVFSSMGEYEGKYVFYNEIKDKYYLIDLEKTDNCTVMTDEQLDKLETKYDRYNATIKHEYYSWESDNTIRKNNYQRFYDGYGYVLVEEEEPGKTYYQKVSIDGWVEAKDDVDEPLYERFGFDLVSGEFDKNREYYAKYVHKEGVMEKVQNPTEEEFKTGNYYLKSEHEPEGEIVLTLTNTKFVLSKEITKLDSDVVYTNSDLMQFQVINGEKYMSFHQNGTPGLTVFKTDGTYLDSYLGIFLYNSNNNIIMTINAYKDISIRDYKYNLIYQTKTSENLSLDQYVYSVGNTDYFAYLAEDDTEGFIRVSYYKVEEGANQTYNNKDLTIKFSGNLNKLSSVKLNNKELNKENYTTESGSTVVTLNKKYLDTLEKGTYTLKVEYNDGGYAETTFIVEEKVPNTFDGISSYIILSIVSLIGLCITILLTRKNKKLN